MKKKKEIQLETCKIKCTVHSLSKKWIILRINYKESLSLNKEIGI